MVEEAKTKIKTNKRVKLRQCAQTKKNIKRVRWYYSHGLYFANKSAYRQWQKTKKEASAAEKAKEAEAAVKAKEAEAATPQA